MAGLTARVAAAVGGTTADAKSRAVSLDVTKTLAVVALLSCANCKHLSVVLSLVLRRDLLSVVLG